jgi:hypothetical protein
LQDLYLLWLFLEGNLPAIHGGEGWLLTYNPNDLTLSVVAVPTPEPANLFLVCGALLGIFGYFRRLWR